jgi:hypothetical protein
MTLAPGAHNYVKKTDFLEGGHDWDRYNSPAASPKVFGKNKEIHSSIHIGASKVDELIRKYVPK